MIISAVYKSAILSAWILQMERVLFSYFYVFISCKRTVDNKVITTIVYTHA